MIAYILCLEDSKRRRHGRVGIKDGELCRIGSAGHFESEIDVAVASLVSNPMVRAESNGDDLGIDAVTAATDDPRLLDELAATFRARGCAARLLDEPRSEAWHLLRVIPVSEEVREAFTASLELMSADDLSSLMQMLDGAKKQLDAIDAEKMTRIKAIEAVGTEEDRRMEKEIKSGKWED